MDLYFWKWTLGEPYYKSARPEPSEKTVSTCDTQEYDTQINAINQSLSDGLISSSNKREDLDNKIADRELVQQIGANPFMQQSSYVNDIVVRDMFLKPINTTQGRVKNNNESATHDN
jgi:hypothetical protein